MPIGSYVAIGDSLTQGVGDPLPDGALRGFADLVALSAATVSPGAGYANLARPSVRAREIARDQVPVLGRLRPDLVTVIAGVNDIIAVRFHADRVAADVESLIHATRDAAPDAIVVCAALPDLTAHSFLARLWRGRVAVVNRAVSCAADAAGIDLVDLTAGRPLARAEIAPDGVHPSPLGHLRFAGAIAGAVGLPAPQAGPRLTAAASRRLRRAGRVVLVAPRFAARRCARERLIAGQPAKRPDLVPVLPAGAGRGRN